MANFREEVNVNIVTSADLRGLSSVQKAFSSFNKDVESLSARALNLGKVSESINGIKQEALELRALTQLKDVGVDFSPNLNKGLGGFRDLKTGIIVGADEVANRVTDLSQGIENDYNDIMKTNNLLKKNTVANFKDIDSFLGDIEKHSKKRSNFFEGEYLSLLFFGMAIQQTFSSIAKSSLSTFKKITESQTEAGQAVTALSANFELLKFSVGQALATTLEALLPVLLPLIVSFADWVQQHEKLVGAIVIVGIALGSLLSITGLLRLGLKGGLIPVLASVWKWLATDIPASVTSSTVALTALGGVLKKIAGVYFISLALADLANFETDSTGKIFQSLGSLASNLGLAAGLLGKGKVAKYGYILGAVGIGVELVGDAISGQDKTLFQDVMDVLTAAFVGFQIGGVPGAVGAIVIAVAFKLASKDLDFEDPLDKFREKGNIAGNEVILGRDISTFSALPEGTQQNNFNVQGFDTQPVIDWQRIMNDSLNQTSASVQTFSVNSSVLLGNTNQNFADLNANVMEFQSSVDSLELPPKEVLDNSFLASEEQKKVSAEMSKVNAEVANMKSLLSGNGEEGTTGLTGNLGTLNTEFGNINNTISTQLQGNVDNLATTLQRNSQAALSAALAHERYNRALDGATGA